MVLPLKFMVTRVAETPWDTFVPNPSDPENTVPGGKKAQELTLVAHTGYPNSKFPGHVDEKAGKLTVLLTDPNQIGQLKPGQFVTIGFVEIVDQ